MARWRIRLAFRLPGPFVLTRISRKAQPCRQHQSAGQAKPGAVGGAISLIVLGYAVSQVARNRGRKSPRKARWIPAWKIYLVLAGIFVLVLVVLL